MSTNPLFTSINHIVILMLENRSFDHMIGFLYPENQSPLGHPYEGLTGTESCKDSNGNAQVVFKIQPSDLNGFPYAMPGADPGEGYACTNNELFGKPPAPNAKNDGFLMDYTETLNWQKSIGRAFVQATEPKNIMGIFTPELVPVLSTLAKQYAVCDHWFSSAPTETMPNRSFLVAGTSCGVMDDKILPAPAAPPLYHSAPTIFGSLSKQNISWGIYGYTQAPLFRFTYNELVQASDDHFGLFTDFQNKASSGTLESVVLLEPSWGTGLHSNNANSQHPGAYNIALGEKLIYDVYYALKNSPKWNETLLIITYDEHGGCYDHVPPPTSSVPPDNHRDATNFDFKRFGLRVPTILVSPKIEAGTVFRVPDGTMPFDHTSILKTIENRWNVPSLTERDKAALDVSDVLTLATCRTDDPLKNVVVPQANFPPIAAPGVSPVPSSEQPPHHLADVLANFITRLPEPTGLLKPTSNIAEDVHAFIEEKIARWKSSI